MGRKKGSLNRKTLQRMENLSETVQQEEQKTEAAPVKQPDNVVAALQKMVEQQTKKINELSEKIAKQEDPSKFHGIESRIKLDNLDKDSVASQEQLNAWEQERQEVIFEMKGNKRQIAAESGGRMRAYEHQTGDSNELRKKLTSMNRAIAYHSPPKLTDAERNKLKKEYDMLAAEIKPVIASYDDQYNQRSVRYQDAVEKAVARETTYAKKIKKWQNIGKILEPDNPRAWDLSKIK